MGGMNARSDTVIAEFAKNRREVIRIAIGDYKGHSLVHVRAWVPQSETGAMIPTRNGLSLRREVIPQLIEALQKVAAADKVADQ
jgi:hypothetical protein